MIDTHVLGFARIGARRELKFALERYWRGESNAEQLHAVGAALRQTHWAQQRAAGLSWVTVGDFAYYDHVANHIQWLGCAPARFAFTPDETRLERYFTLCRGQARSGAPTRPALELTKWFDTNYHYLVPEFSPTTRFTLQAEDLLAELAQARALGHAVKVALIGPVSLLWLGKEKSQSGDDPGFTRLSLLEPLLAAYAELIDALHAGGAQWVQLDEPVLGLELNGDWRHALQLAYTRLAGKARRLLLASYFSALADNLQLACRLPVDALHIDAVSAPEELVRVADWLPAHKLLSVGIVDGRNVWRADPDALLATLRPVLARRGRLWLAPSCSLLHLPYSLHQEDALDPQLRGWLAFGAEKLVELGQVARLLAAEAAGQPAASADVSALDQARAAGAARRASPRVHRPEVTARLESLPADADRRAAPLAERLALQAARLQLPRLPTTTIGSFPQTAEIRAARAARARGELDEAGYQSRMRAEIAHAIAQQEALGLDVLVHGEAERSDMVEYFAQRLDGYAISQHGWVQSYGSRCVRPPILYGDVSRPAPMTLEWTRYAQSLTRRPVKGMLTGPVTLLEWSFVRDDQPRARSALQLALAVRDEVADLQSAGIAVIQIDEPALREGLPLRRSAWAAHLAHAVHAFRVAAGAAAPATQIHTHMCYSEFNEILPDIAALDADVVTIEASRSDMELLDAFARYDYPGEVGPGVWDIHSPRIPTAEEIHRLLSKALLHLPAQRLWVNPDCGLKTRNWAEVCAALAQMMAATRALRTALADRR